MKIYTIIGGVNGVGKSSFTGALKAQPHNNLGVIIDVDKITAENGGDLIQGGKQAVQEINRCLENGYSFTQETTLSGIKTAKTIRAAKDKGYFIRLYYIGLDTLEESLARIRNRVQKGGHAIDSGSVERRFDARFDALLSILPYCDEAFLFDNQNGFVKVAEYSNGEIVPLTRQIPPWLETLLAYK